MMMLLEQLPKIRSSVWSFRIRVDLEIDRHDLENSVTVGQMGDFALVHGPSCQTVTGDGVGQDRRRLRFDLPARVE